MLKGREVKRRKGRSQEMGERGGKGGKGRKGNGKERCKRWQGMQEEEMRNIIYIREDNI
jgi:hypothetical protein